jgi:hypothetical protein
MLHLFKRVYLSLDETLDTANHRVVVSQDYGHAMGTDETDLGTLLAYAGSIEDLIGTGKSFATYLDFFNYLNTTHDSMNDVVVVYADRSSFVKVGTNFFKALLPLAQLQDIYKILSFYAVRQSLLCTNYDFQGLVQNYEALKSKAAFTEAEVSAEFFANRVNSIDFYNFFADKRSTLSIEFIAATYSYNGGCRAEILELVKAFAIKHAYMYAMEVRQEIVDTCMTPHTQSILNIANVPISQMADILRRADSTALFFDDRVFPKDTATINLDANWRKLSTADVTKLCRTMLKVLTEISLWRDNTQTDKMGLTAMISAIQEINNPTAWNQKLEILLDNLAELTAESETYKVNTILCYNIQTARISNNKESLRPFVINGCQ